MTKVTIMLTWYSVMAPSLTRTCCSLIQALRTLRSVLFARASPCWMASSKLFFEVALISDTLAIDIHASFLLLGTATHRPREKATARARTSRAPGPDSSVVHVEYQARRVGEDGGPVAVR